MSIPKWATSPAAKLLASIALLLVAARLLDWHDLADAVARLDAAHLLLAFGGALAVLFCLAARWAVMAREIEQGQALRHFRDFLFGICISSVTPANIGADLYRFASLRRAGKGWEIVGLLIQEKLLLLVGYFALAAASAALAVPAASSPDKRLLLSGIACLAAVAFAIPFVLTPILGLLARHRLLAGKPQAVLERMQRLTALGSARRYLPPLGLSLLSILCWLATVTALAAALRPGLPLPLLWLTAIVADIVRWMPITLQGIGVREAAFASLFLFFGADPARGFALGGIGYLLVTVAMIAAGGIALLIDLVRRVAGR